MKRLLASAIAVAVLLASATPALAQRPYYRPGPAFRFNFYGGGFYPGYRPYYAPYYGPPAYYPPPAPYYYPPPVYAPVPPPVIAPGFSIGIGR